MTGRWVGWMTAAVVAVGGMCLTPVFGADAGSRPIRGEWRRSGEGVQHDSRHAAAKPTSSGAYDSGEAGNADANIPPETLHQLALQYGLSAGELAQAVPESDEEYDAEVAEYDPWEPFNRVMFEFNRRVDRFVLKPAATAWNFVVPDLAQQSLANAFDNIAMPRRVVNNLLQLKLQGAGLELARFFLNTSMGVGGFFDVATELGVPRSEADTGQTLGRYGVGPGPYLVLPFLPPLTVRDGIGLAGDTAMQPIAYVAPLEAAVPMRVTQAVNDRSQNLETFEELERVTFDLYTAVRNAYLQRRQRLIER